MNIPQELRNEKHWVIWKQERRNGKLTKVPYDPKTGQFARSNDPTTWSDFEYASHAVTSHDCDGIGFMLYGSRFVGIDFDGVVDDGVPEPYVLNILQQLGSPYAEVTPSGTGLRAFVECQRLPPGNRKFGAKKKGVDKYGAEIYAGNEGGRYLTLTGDKFSGNGIPKVDNLDLPYFLISKFADERFRRLWIGDASNYADDDSRVDMALLGALLRATQGDANKAMNLFSASVPGHREKWVSREDYRRRTLSAVMTTYQTGKEASPSSPSPEIQFHTEGRADPDGEYVLAPAEGQDDGWFPLGDISLVGGASGTGKTSLIFEMLYKQRHKEMFLGHRSFGYRFHVLAYDRGKNAFTRTMRRLRFSPSEVPTTPLPLAFDTQAVQNIINEIERLVPTPDVVFLEGLDMLIEDANKKAIVSPFMRSLQRVAEHFHIALIGSLGAPKTKRGEDYAAKRDHLSGSEAWGRNCETVAILEFSDEDDGTAPQRELTVLPRNAKAEKFSLQFEGGRLVQVLASPDEKHEGGRPDEAFQRARSFIEMYLQKNPEGVPEKRIREAAAVSEEKITDSTVRRALSKMEESREVRRFPMMGKTCWTLCPVYAGATKIVTEGV